MAGTGKVILTVSGLVLAACAALVALSAWAQSSSQPSTSASITTEDGWFARPEVTRPPLPEKITRAFVIPIREEIATKTYAALQRKVRICLREQAELVILDMDTWGGEVIAALDIAREIKRDLGETRTCCFINTRAVSAGSLIALACNDRLMVPSGVLGDAAPISPAGKIEGVEREKIETVLRSEFKESAKRDGLPEALAQKIVSWDMEAWLVRNKKTRELRYVLEEQWRGQVDVPPGVSSAPSAPSAKWELVRVIVPKGRLLTMDTEEAVKYGFVEALPRAPLDAPLAEVLKHYGIQGAPTVLGDTWSEKLVEFLASAPVMGFLFFVAILCAYVEINAPGHIVPGIIAVLCFAVIFGSRYLVGMSDWWQIALFLAGVLLIGLEIFVIPGHGVAGIAGGLCCLVALLAILVPHVPGTLPVPTSATAWSIFADGLFALGAGFVLGVVGALVAARYLPKVPLASKLLLPEVSPPIEPTLSTKSAYQRVRTGDVGVVEGMCRPVGKVRFGDDLLDAASEGAIIEPGAKVRVLRREGNQVIVERL